MNFYDLFEASKDLKGKDAHEHDVSIVDPKAALALKTARNKYSYADSDLEAFIKLQQDQEEEDQNEFDELEAAVAKNKQTVANLKKQEAETQELLAKKEDDINTLRAMTQDQETELSKLRAQAKEFEGYKSWASKIRAEIDDLDNSLASAKDSAGKALQIAPRNTSNRASLPTAPAQDAPDSELPQDRMSRAYKRFGI